MKKLIIVAALLSISSVALACRSWMIRTPDGKTVMCLECCDSSGACNVTCQ